MIISRDTKQAFEDLMVRLEINPNIRDLNELIMSVVLCINELANKCDRLEEKIKNNENGIDSLDDDVRDINHTLSHNHIY